MSEFEAKKRDWFLTEAVCQEQMEFYPRSISRPKVMEAIEGRNPDREHTQSLSWDRTYKYFECLILRYSAGEEVDSLRAPCKEMFEEFGRHKRMFPEWNMKYWEPDAYQYLMWLLGLAYLFNLPEYVPQIATWYAHNTDAGDDDPLICALFSRLGCNVFNVPQNDMVFEKTYRPLLKALQAGAERKDEAQKHLEAYLKGWYKGMKDCYWYNRHKGKFATHFGYWSFESGLVSVLCGLDDSAFRDMLYYPKDLVDYARAHPFEPLSEQRKQTLRALPGEPCPKTGDWYALHLGGKVVSLREGEPMPGPEYGPTGVVIWYLKG